MNDMYQDFMVIQYIFYSLQEHLDLRQFYHNQGFTMLETQFGIITPCNKSSKLFIPYNYRHSSLSRCHDIINTIEHAQDDAITSHGSHMQCYDLSILSCSCTLLYIYNIHCYITCGYLTMLVLYMNTVYLYVCVCVCVCMCVYVYVYIIYIYITYYHHKK